MDILSQIIAKKRERIAEAQKGTPLERLRQEVMDTSGLRKPHALRSVLKNNGINIIAEFKRRSPSKGVIRADADLYSLVRSYQAGGAVALSILTEEDYFDGSLSDLRTAKAFIDLPVLRKDFIVDEYQLYESAVNGADAILLIVAALDDQQLDSLRRLAEDELGIDALVEVHNAEEMDRAANCGAKLLGVNNRNLRTFEVSLDTSVQLAKLAPADALLVSESGLTSAADLRRLKKQGFNGFLIGESLMRAPNPEVELRDLRADQKRVEK